MKKTIYIVLLLGLTLNVNAQLQLVNPDFTRSYQRFDGYYDFYSRGSFLYSDKNQIFSNDYGKTWFPKNDVNFNLSNAFDIKSFNNRFFTLERIYSGVNNWTFSHVNFCISTSVGTSGISWKKINLLNVAATFMDFAIISDQEYVLLGGPNFTINDAFRTTDGGVSWTSLNLPASAISNFQIPQLKVYLENGIRKWKLNTNYTNRDYFYINGSWSTATGVNVAPLVTFTGCLTNQTLPSVMGSSSQGYTVENCYFLNSLNGIAFIKNNTLLGLSHLYTSNGGVTWQKGQDINFPYRSGPCGDDVAWGNNFSQRSFYTKNDTEWLCVFNTSMAVYKSNDLGASWQLKNNSINLKNQFTTQCSGSEGAITSSFLKDSVTFFAGINSKIWRTTNGGTNWTRQFSGTYSFGFNTFHFADDNSGFGFAFGNKGTILKSSDNGSTWAVILTFPNQKDALFGHFYTKDLGYVYACTNNSSYYSDCSIYTTNDGAASWTKRYDLNIPEYRNYDKIGKMQEFTNNGKSYIIGYGIFTSTNSGVSWSKVSSEIVNDYQKLSGDSIMFLSFPQTVLSFNMTTYTANANFITPMLTIDNGKAFQKLNIKNFIEPRFSVSQYPLGPTLVKLDYKKTGYVYLDEPTAGYTFNIYKFKPFGNTIIDEGFPKPTTTSLNLCGTYTSNGKISFNTTVQSASASSGTRALWSFEGKNGTSYTISNCGGGADTKMRIYSSSSNLLSSVDDTDNCEGTEAEITWECTSDGTYYVLLTNYDCDVLDRSQTISYTTGSTSPKPVAWTIPAVPNDRQGPITIYFDAAVGVVGPVSSSLKDYTGDVYIHTGVGKNGVKWQNVVSAWATTQPNTKMTRDAVNPNLYSITISSLRDYYYNPANNTPFANSDIVSTICAVFRSADGSLEGKNPILNSDGSNDIFLLTTVASSSIAVNTLGGVRGVIVTTIDTELKAEDFDFYPNPTDGVLNFLVPKAATLTIYSVQGYLKLKLALHKGENLVSTNLSTGIYIVDVDGIKKKLVVE